MSESSTSAGAGETGMDGGDGAVVVLLSVWWKNPFLWMALGMGIPCTIIAAGEGEPLRNVTLVFAALTVVLAGAAHVSLISRLEIRPNGFREDHAFWRTIEHRWADVSRFAVRKDSEAEDAVSFLVLKNGRDTGESDILMGAYGESVEALTDRMNAAREKALGPGATDVANGLPRRTTRKA
jgi:hypothetical protein